MALVSEYVDVSAEDAKRARRERMLARINGVAVYLNILGLGWLAPLARIAAGDIVKPQLKELRQGLLVPLVGIGAFLLAWALAAPQVKTSLGAIPGPAEVWVQAQNLYADHRAERAKQAAFYERQDARNAKAVADGHPEEVRHRNYAGKPTYFDQIVTSLVTVALGFVVATLVAVPLGILCGLSKTMNGALNPLIQIFKPVSPLAWLPIVTMVVSALYVNPSEFLPKSLVISAITVTLCSLWPTLINTALGVASIDKDLLNVGRVLQLPTWRTITKLVLPSSLPLIFTGLRLSLGVGWMVLIAAEMLAQNPGLGKFVWDEFQNGSSQSLARIIVAVLTIGIIGFLLDRVMYALQSAFTFSSQR
ncbi:ABC transporter permease [Bradyrhizobium sp. CCBAU 53415]|uniref:ABC transporter permease n=1 Tax=Bradyrhizobium sp. CCBAU 53415 TaxID=1325119 RepID=UPI002305905E|nr:ABC transporter permease [Bradyrhizobium sp. CCBAU 53415]MDA9468597.1 nitrate ABC transporter permease [Bradyrhizobium sp. CCBAU 53415]